MASDPDRWGTGHARHDGATSDDDHGDAPSNAVTGEGRYEAHREWESANLIPELSRLAGIMPGARAAKTAGAVGIAWWIGTLLGEPHPIFAALGALVAVEPTIVGSVRRSALQLVGVMGGIGLAAALSYVTEGTRAGLVAVVVLLGLWLGRLLRSADRIGVELSVTALLVVVLGQGNPGFGFSRLWEIGLGGLVATSINALIAPPNYLPAVVRSLDALVDEVSDELIEAVRIFVEMPNHEGAADVRESIRITREGIPEIRRNLDLARRALGLSPLLRGSGPAVDRAAIAFKLYSSAASHAAGTARVLVQHAQRPHSWSHAPLDSPSNLLLAAASLAIAMKHFQAYVREGLPAPLGDARQELRRAQSALRSFYDDAAREREGTAMERLVDVAAIASEIEHLTRNAAEEMKDKAARA